MSKWKANVGDLVLTWSEPIAGYEEKPHVSNQMCIVRKHIERKEYLCEYRYLYRCTLISTGEEVDLWPEEFTVTKG